MANKNSNNESKLKETSPNISAGQPIESRKLTRRYDLVEQMQFLFVRVVRGRGMPNNAIDLFVEIKVGNIKATTRFFGKNNPYPEWNQVFAFEKDKIQDLSVMDVLVKQSVGAIHISDALFGQLKIPVSDVPRRVPPEPSLAPKWYRLEDQNGAQLARGDIMLSLWMGTQVDEYFPQAWCSDATSSMSGGDAVGYTRSKVYILPTLWYLRVNVIQAQGLLLRINPNNPGSDIFVKVDLGHLSLRTNFSKYKSANPLWNEDLMFVAQEPFSETLVLSVEQGTLAEHVCLGRYELPLKNVDKRLDNAGVAAKWYNLHSPEIIENNAKGVKFASKFNARISLDGAYHVMDELIEYSSDFRPSAKKLWKPSIGVLELGILKATNLVPMKMGTRTDAYCVAKYGPKWVQTRTIVNSLSPKWNEQYIWEVYEPYTVISIAVFDNNQFDANNRAAGAKDAVMGKIRIRLSALERGKVYTHSYPLVALQPSGVRKMGELHLAVRFSRSTSLIGMYKFYTEPLLPRHHHAFPLSPAQYDTLRNQTAIVISLRLCSAEPPIRKEVVYYMLDMRSDMWSTRKARANVERIMSLIVGFVVFWKWLQDIKSWKNPATTLLFIIACMVILSSPETILPMMFFYIFYVGLKGYFKRPRHPCYIDAKLSGAETANPDDLEEELDPCPTQLEGKTLRMRYDRLRCIAISAQRMANDLATTGERLQSLCSWRDRRATIIFLVFCAICFFVGYFVNLKIIIFIWIVVYLRHPRFRTILPSYPQNFLKRMSSKQAFIL